MGGKGIDAKGARYKFGQRPEYWSPLRMWQVKRLNQEACGKGSFLKNLRGDTV